MLLSTYLFLAALKQLTCTDSASTSPSRAAKLDSWWATLSTSYPRYNATTELLHEIQKTFSNLVNVYSVGQSVQGREMWVIQISENPARPRLLLKPMVKIVGNIHGDEALGRQLILLLAVSLLKRHFQGDPRAERLLHTTDLHLMPTMNPDGYEMAVEGECFPLSSLQGRANQNRVDLNRNFPEQFSEKKEEESSMYEPETLNIMKWIVTRPFVLSTSLHGGSLVANYPYDSVPLSIGRAESYLGFGVPSLSPDNKVFLHLATLYSKAHRRMHEPSPCTGDRFPGGVVNGAKWYEVRGGMQDFNYVRSNCFEITLELACCKFPPSSSLREEWGDNEEPLLQYIEAVHMGVHGLVLGEDRRPVPGASIQVQGIDHEVTATEEGEFWRLLAPGEYQIRASASGHMDSHWSHVHIPNKTHLPHESVRLDFSLLRNKSASVLS